MLNRIPGFYPGEALQDMESIAQDELVRSGNPTAMEDIGFDVPTPGAMETRTFPRAAGKGGDFICGCTVEVDRVEEAGPYVPVEHRPWRDNVPTLDEKAAGQSAIGDIRSKHNLGN